MDLKSFYVQPTQGELKNSDDQVNHRSDFDELLGMSTSSMDFNVVSVEGETQLQAYMQLKQVSNDTDPVGCGVSETVSARVSRLGPNG
jgi:hypothetical protein